MKTIHGGKKYEKESVNSRSDNGSLCLHVGQQRRRVSAETAGSLPIKALTGKVVEKNPYMADSDANIHHDCYNTDSTDEILPVGIYSEINVSYEKTNANASPAIFFDSYGHAVVPLLGGLAIRVLMPKRLLQKGIFLRHSMTAEDT